MFDTDHYTIEIIWILITILSRYWILITILSRFIYVVVRVRLGEVPVGLRQQVGKIRRRGSAVDFEVEATSRGSLAGHDESDDNDKQTVKKGRNEQTKWCKELSKWYKELAIKNVIKMI